MHIGSGIGEWAGQGLLDQEAPMAAEAARNMNLFSIVFCIDSLEVAAAVVRKPLPA